MSTGKPIPNLSPEIRSVVGEFGFRTCGPKPHLVHLVFQLPQSINNPGPVPSINANCVWVILLNEFSTLIRNDHVVFLRKLYGWDDIRISALAKANDRIVIAIS